MNKNIFLVFVFLFMFAVIDVNADDYECSYISNDYWIVVTIQNKQNLDFDYNDTLFGLNQSNVRLSDFVNGDTISCPKYVLVGSDGSNYIVKFSDINRSSGDYLYVVENDPDESGPISGTTTEPTPTSPEKTLLRKCYFGDSYYVEVYSDNSLVGKYNNSNVTVHDSINAFNGGCPDSIYVDSGPGHELYTNEISGSSKIFSHEPGYAVKPAESQQTFHLGDDPKIRDICESSGFLTVLHMVLIIVNILKLAVPLVLIGMLTMDIYPLIGNPGEVSKVVKKSKNRLIAAILIFFVPTIMQLILNALGDSTTVSTCYDHATDTGYIEDRKNAEKAYFSGN